MSKHIATQVFDSRQPVDVEEHENPLTAAPGPKPKNPHIFIKLYMNHVIETGLFAEIDPALWKTLCAISKYINEDGTCWATEETLARDLGKSQTAVSASILRLEKMLDGDGHQLLKVVRRRKEDGSYKPNIYTLNPNVGLHIFQSTPFGVLLKEERGREAEIFSGVTRWRPEPKPSRHELYGSLGDFLILDTRRN